MDDERDFYEQVETIYREMSEAEKREYLNRQRPIHLYKNDLASAIKDLNFEERGKLLTLIVQQVTMECYPDAETGESIDIQTESRAIRFIYRIFGEKIQEDNAQYIKKCIGKSINGKQGGRGHKKAK